MRLQPSQSCISGVLHSKHTQARELPSQACDGPRYKKPCRYSLEEAGGMFSQSYSTFLTQINMLEAKKDLGFY